MELDGWDPRPALLDLEGQLAADRSMDADLVAACKTVRDSLDAAGGEIGEAELGRASGFCVAGPSGPSA